MPIDRDRRRAKRRYTRRQAAEAARAARRRGWARILVAVSAIVALAAGIYGITRMSGRVGASISRATSTTTGGSRRDVQRSRS